MTITGILLIVLTTATICFSAAHSFSDVTATPSAVHRPHQREDGFVSTDDSSSTASSTTTWTAWNHVLAGPPDSILGLAKNFRDCTDPRKVNLVIGAYRDANGSPWVLPSVLQAEEQILHAQKQGTGNKEYLPIEGDVEFIRMALAFAYGKDQDLNRIAGVQSLSGTGACRIGGQFLALFYRGNPCIYIPNPTWGNHWKIFDGCGLQTRPYRYYDPSRNALDIQGLLEDIEQAPDESIILLHACAHNPTGCDPSRDQWEKIADVVKSKKHLCFFDSAYQGFASGDAEQDAWALRFFVEQNVPIVLAQSFAKNFGLYGERCGTMSVICANAEEKEVLLSQLRCIIRPLYSSPPRHGSSIVKTVLSDEQLTAQYYEECRSMANRIAQMRTRLVEALRQAGSTHNWSHISSQIGMFAYTGMTADMVDELTARYAIFMTRDGRISLAGLNEQNVRYVAEAVHSVTIGKSITHSI
jgi:aspartate aminotransferase